MFSDKNYGLPKDLIEAAKRVHEKHLMEYDEDGHIDNPPEGTKGTKKDREKAAKMGLKGPHLEGEGRVTKKQKQNIPPLPVRKPKNEEVQFTEEELAEAFAIFLEENFHVEMLTEEDIDYVFEEEFPQWLDVIVEGLFDSDRKSQLAIMGLDSNEKPKPGSKYNTRARIKNVLIRQRVKKQSNVGGAESGKAKGSARDLPQYLPHRSNFNDMHNAPVIKNIPTGEDAQIKKEKEKLMTGGLDDGAGAGNPPLPTRNPKPTAKPASTAKKQVRRPAPKPQSFGSLLRKVGGNAPATTATAAGRRKVKLLDARARARTAARDASGRGQPSWAKAAFEPKD